MGRPAGLPGTVPVQAQGMPRKVPALNLPGKQKGEPSPCIPNFRLYWRNAGTSPELG